MKWFDIPPLWLAGFSALAWGMARFLDAGISFAGPVIQLFAGLLIGAGVVLIALASTEFRRHRTTIIPHQTPARLIQSGIFSRSRNPVYLGDTLILAGCCLWFGAIFALALVPVFAWIIEQRFILPEENRMRREFRADYARYERKVRRWV